MATVFPNDRFKGLLHYGLPMLHGLGWLLYVGMVLYVVIPRVSWPFFIAYHGCYLVCQAVAFYITYLYTVPRLLARQKFISFWLTTLLLLISLSVLSIIFYNWMSHQAPVSEFRVNPLAFQKRTPARLLGLVIVTGLALFSRLGIDWVIYRQQQIEQEKDHLQIELAFLKAQLNPHFLLNTLNSLYALSLKQSPQTPEVIMNLSQLMRYLLYETGDEQIPLAKELEAIQHYIDLQELRLSAPKAVSITMSGPVATTQIAPFLLLPLVENMFKHGRLPMAIELIVSDRQLHFQTRNGLRDQSISDSVGGIGLRNLRRRLDLLYPSQHELVCASENGFFLVSLRLNW
ncbi:sensor histidine kinase [Spirosoma gilvum]